MRGFQLVGWQKPPELREVSVPEPGPGEVLLKVGGAGACYSDLHLMEAPQGSASAMFPFTLGHENAGWVERLGVGAAGYAGGDPVLCLAFQRAYPTRQQFSKKALIRQSYDPDE
jgi:alcohol dehydrogenase, propanol-preferring